MTELVESLSLSQSFQSLRFPEDNRIALFTHLFSAPLIHEKDDGHVEEVPILDYSKERKALKELFQKQQVRIRWNSEVSNAKNFLNAFSNSKILHFTGHGKDGKAHTDNIVSQSMKHPNRCFSF